MQRLPNKALSNIFPVDDNRFQMTTPFCYLLSSYPNQFMCRFLFSALLLLLFCKIKQLCQCTYQPHH